MENAMKLEEINLIDLELFVSGDPHEAFRVLRREAPVHWQEPKPGLGFWSVTRYDDALSVYHDPATFSSERGIALTMSSIPADAQPGFGQMMIMTDPPLHTRQRQVINKRFTPRAVEPYEPGIRKITSEIIDDVAERGACDFVVDVAARLPSAVTCEMMGIAPQDRDLMFTIANMSIGAEDPEYQSGRSAVETGQQAQAEAFSYFSRLIEERRREPGEDLISAFVHGEIDGRKVTDMEVLFNAFLLLIAGQETTRNAASGGMLAMIQHPDQYQRLKQDAALFPTAIEEILRWTTPVTHIMRTAKADAELRGQQIRKGDMVVIWNASANRDEQAFPDPYRFDLSRAPNDHLAFGHGEHFCLGANLARLELRVLLEELMRRLPDIELAGEPQRLRSNFVAGIKHMPVRFPPVGRATA